MKNSIDSRVSLRVYDSKAIQKGHLESILNAIMKSPTAGNQQLYSVLVVTDGKTKKKLAVSCDNQKFIEKAPLILIFLADQKKWFDYLRMKKIPEWTRTQRDYVWEEPGLGDMLLAVDDALIAAQSAVLQGEALGIGSCYIGDIMEQYEFHKELFHLPENVFPAAMLCMGYYPEGYRRVPKSRFEKKYVIFDEKYNALTEEDLKDMFSNREEEYQKRANKSDDSYALFFYKRKTGASYAKEMNRSVKEMLKPYL